MTWGSSCSMCGRVNCSWVDGWDCEGLAAQRIEARSDETLQAAQPVGRDPDPAGDAPKACDPSDPTERQPQ